jgi:hypothetical protein
MEVWSGVAPEDDDRTEERKRLKRMSDVQRRYKTKLIAKIKEFFGVQERSTREFSRFSSSALLDIFELRVSDDSIIEWKFAWIKWCDLESEIKFLLTEDALEDDFVLASRQAKIIAVSLRELVQEFHASIDRTEASKMEEWQHYVCGYCGVMGHNRRTCPSKGG